MPRRYAKDTIYLHKQTPPQIYIILGSKVSLTKLTYPRVLESNPLSWLEDLGLDLLILNPSALLRELLLEDPLNSPCNIFCLAGSKLFSNASAWSLKWSANPQNALKIKYILHEIHGFLCINISR